MRSVVVVLPASMCAMIPMFRVFSSENLRAMDRDLVSGSGLVEGKKMGPSGPRALLVDLGPVRVVICSRSPSFVLLRGDVRHAYVRPPRRLSQYSRANARPTGVRRPSETDFAPLRPALE